MIGTKVKTISQSIRWPFLLLTPACLFLGWSSVIAEQVEVELHFFVLSFLGAMLAHISVNTLNEYLDFESGLDLLTKRTEFSGGSGALPDAPEMAKTVLGVGIGSLVITLVIGLFFIWQYGWGIAPLGIVGLLLIIVYTRWVNKYPYLCLVAPGLGFGLLMVLGANFSLTGEYSKSLLMVSLVPFFLVNNLLLLNQYPDIDADRRVGRNHFPIAFGINRSNFIYGLFVALTIAVILVAVTINILPTLSLIALLPMPLAFFALTGAIKYGAELGSQPQYLAANVAVTILTVVLLSVSIALG